MYSVCHMYVQDLGVQKTESGIIVLLLLLSPNVDADKGTR